MKMTIKCRHCGEQWEVTELLGITANGERVRYEQAKNMFSVFGCGAFDPQPQVCRDAPLSSDIEHSGTEALLDVLDGDVDQCAGILGQIDAAFEVIESVERVS